MSTRSPSTVVVVAVGSALVVLLAGACVVLAVGHPVPTELWAAAGALSGALVGILAPPPPAKTAAELATIETASGEITRSAMAHATAAAAEEVKDSPGARAAEAAVARVEAPAVTGLAGLRSSRSAASLPDLARAAANAAITAHDARDDDPSTSSMSPEEAAAATRVFAAAAQGADQARASAEATAIKAGTAAPSTPLGLDPRITVLAVICVLAFVAGVWLSLEVGHDKAAEAFENDSAIRNAGTALIALGSSAAGAIVGLLAPQPTDKNTP